MIPVELPKYFLSVSQLYLNEASVKINQSPTLKSLLLIASVLFFLDISHTNLNILSSSAHIYM